MRGNLKLVERQAPVTPPVTLFPVLEESRARVLKRRLNRIMREVARFEGELIKLEEEIPAPTLAQLQAMSSGERPVTYATFFLGLVATVTWDLSDVLAYWRWRASYTSSNFPCDLSSELERLGDVIEWRAYNRRQG
jgi:hypothetical protein